MRNIQSIRDSSDNTILALGNYRPGYQAILDFDYLCGRQSPSIVGIVTGQGRYQKYFWGESEVLIPCFRSIEAAQAAIPDVGWMLNINSGRRAAQSTKEFFDLYPDAHGGHIFAENVPEASAIEIYNTYQLRGKTLIGPAGVGMLVPGSLKLGVIGGVDWRQISANRLTTPGNVAILSASGGMINELITITAKSHSLSFALCFGGDRFPATAPSEAFLAAEADPATKYIVYYGELGGQDEYEVADLVESGQLTKPIIAYISGVIGESFDQPVQFGHAKAMASIQSETASAKRRALNKAGVTVVESINDLADAIAKIPAQRHDDLPRAIGQRRATQFSSTISSETSQGYRFVEKTLPAWAETGDIALQITSALLGRQPKSQLTTDFIRNVFLLSVDHGPQVSGALNTIVTSRAGKGLVDSLASGLLTIGPRFGGAVTDAARTWFHAVQDSTSPTELLEAFARQKQRIGGIGHKKYRLGLADPRTEVLARFTERLDSHRYYDYAKQVEELTTAKNGSLILNVDGTIAALMLDILEQSEKVSPTELDAMIEADFFNALFVIPRSVGLTAHYLDQKRLDEGLYRLPVDDIRLA